MDGKELKWAGSSLKDLTAFPDSARREAGYQLHHVQFGMDPKDITIATVRYRAIVADRTRGKQHGNWH